MSSRSNIKGTLLFAAGAFGAFLLMPMTALADSFPSAAAIAQAIIQVFIAFYTATVHPDFIGIQSNAAGNAGHVAGTIAATGQQTAVANMQGQQAMSELEEFRRMEHKASDVNQAAKQPVTSCQAINTAANMTTAMNTAASRGAANVQVINTRLASNVDTGKLVVTNFANSSNVYCSADDIARQRCTSGTASSDPHYAGADRNAATLFGSVQDGSIETYDGPKQLQASNDYINRLVASMPPEMLKTQDWEKTVQGKAYVEEFRNYQAVTSLGAYSLSQIQASHSPIQGLGDSTLASDVTKNPNAGLMEVVGAFVKAQFSAPSFQALATGSAEEILRYIAHNDALNLYINFEQLKQGQRVEAMTAANLELTAEQVMRPQLAQEFQAAQAAMSKH
jgi:hypothetical protein